MSPSKVQAPNWTPFCYAVMKHMTVSSEYTVTVHNIFGINKVTKKYFIKISKMQGWQWQTKYTKVWISLQHPTLSHTIIPTYVATSLAYWDISSAATDV